MTGYRIYEIPKESRTISYHIISYHTNTKTRDGTVHIVRNVPWRPVSYFMMISIVFYIDFRDFKDSDHHTQRPVTSEI